MCRRSVAGFGSVATVVGICVLACYWLVGCSNSGVGGNVNENAGNGNINDNVNVNDNVDDQAEPALEVTTRDVTVELPEGIEVSLDKLRAVNAFGTADVDAAGQSQIQAFGDAPQLVIINSPNDEPMLMGWVSEDSPTINCRTTADVLIFYALRGFAVPEDVQEAVLDFIAEEPDIDLLEDAIAASLTANPDCFGDVNVEVTDAVQDVVNALAQKYGVDEQSGRMINLLSINPSEKQSGVLVNHASGPKRIEIVNEYRRRGYVYIEQQSYTRKSDGVEIPDVQPHSDFWMRPTEGIGEGVLDAVKDYFKALYGVGDSPYAPVSTGPIDLPLYPDSSKTTYYVKVLGAGMEDGDYDMLNADELTQLYIVWATTLTVDIVLPAIINVALPIKNFGSLSKDGVLLLIGSPDNYALYEDLINAVKDAPGVMEAMRDGHPDVAASIIVEQLFIEGNAVRYAAVKAISATLLMLEAGGYIKDATITNAEGALGSFAKVLRALSLFDIVLGVGDLGATLVHISWSDQANVWEVIVTEEEVSIDPEESQIEMYDHQGTEGGGSFGDRNNRIRHGFDISLVQYRQCRLHW